MQCTLSGASAPPIINVPAVFCAGDVASILTDNGVGANFTGSFKMQPGTYQVELYANVIGCGFVAPSIDNNVVGVNWFSSVSAGNCSPTPQNGIIASALIMQFSVNQILTFPVFSGSSLSFGSAILIVTKLQ
jgi:hypothetical protein